MTDFIVKELPYFYTINTVEKAYVQASLPQFSYEGPQWYAQTVATDTDTPVFRFYNSATAAHFYTASAAERDYIRQTYPTYTYEGIGYYAWASAN